MTIKHEEIANHLREAIRAGEYPPGSTIPPLPELVRKYRVARNTVRDAVGALTQEGLVTPLQGVGTVVRDTTPVVLTLRSNETSPLWDGIDELVRAEWGSYSPEVSELFRSDDYLYRVRHQWRGEQVVQLHEQWIPRSAVNPIHAAGIVLDDPQNPPETDLYTAMTRAGMAPETLSETVAARAPDPDETRTMTMPPGVPVVLVRRITWDSNESPLETSMFTGSADRVSHEYQFPYRSSAS